MSTLIKEGMPQDDLVTTNIKKINDDIAENSYIVDRYEKEEFYDTNPESNRKILTDYKVTVFQTTEFQQEQYRVNVHHKNIRNHKINEDGRAIIKPMRDQFTGKK